MFDECKLRLQAGLGVLDGREPECCLRCLDILFLFSEDDLLLGSVIFCSIQIDSSGGIDVSDLCIELFFAACFGDREFAVGDGLGIGECFAVRLGSIGHSFFFLSGILFFGRSLRFCFFYLQPDQAQVVFVQFLLYLFQFG